MQEHPPTITTAELHSLVGRAEPLWLIYVPDDADVGRPHIPGSLASGDEELLAALADRTPMIVYGNDTHAMRARVLAARFAGQGRDARWYAGGVRAWTDAGHPTESA